MPPGARASRAGHAGPAGDAAPAARGGRTDPAGAPLPGEDLLDQPGPGGAEGGAHVAGTFSVDDAYRDHAGVLYGYAVHAVGDRAEAEDLVQEAFTRAWHASSRYDPARASVRTWLFSITRNLVLDAHRARGRRPRVSDQLTGDAPPEAEPSTPGPEDEVVERLRMVEALARISPEHREVVAAVHLDGRSYSELATTTGVPAATLRTRMYYGLRALRAVLDEIDGDGLDGLDGTDEAGRRVADA